MNEEQRVDLYQPLIANRVGPAPIVIRAGITPQADHLVGGVPRSAMRAETYVLLSVLPDELRRQVELCIQMHVSAI